MKNWLRSLLLLEIVAIIGLQMTFWDHEGGIQKIWQLEQTIAEQRLLLDERRLRNHMLATEVSALKTDADALEEKARLDLGMIREGETFFHLVD